MDGVRIGLLYDQVPLELLYAGGARAVPLSGRVYATKRAEDFFPNFFCPYAASVLEGYFNGAYDFLDGVILTNACNALEKVYDIWRDRRLFAHLYLLDVPRKSDALSRRFFREGLLHLKSYLEGALDTAIRDEAIWAAIRRTNAIDERIEALYRLFTRTDYGFSYTRFLQMMEDGISGGQVAYETALDDSLRGVQSEVRLLAAQKKRRPTVLLAGSMVADARLITMIESAGLRIAAEELVFGHRRWRKRIDENRADPLEALADAYLAQTNTTRTTTGAGEKAARYLALYDELAFDGVIYLSLRFCVNHAYDFAAVKRSFERAGVPVILVECDYSGAGLEQLKTRIQAFAEML